MSPELIAALLAALVGPPVTLWVTSRKLSGRINTSEADSLWKEAESMRGDYRAQLEVANKRILRIEERVAKLDEANTELQRENIRLLKTIAKLGGTIEGQASKIEELEKTITELKQTITDLREQLEVEQSRVREEKAKRGQQHE